MRLPALSKIQHVWRRWRDRLPRALAIGLGLRPADPDWAGRLRTAQIAAIVRLTPLTMGASCLNAAILLLTLGYMGSLRLALWIWSALVVALAVRYGRNWRASRHRDPSREATSRAIPRVIINGGVFGALWGAVPVLIFPGAPPLIQLLVGCLTAGMMCAGGFVLATVPLAGVIYVLMVAAGASIALLQEGSPVYLGLFALMTVYTVVVIVNLNWIAFLFISHFLAEAQVQTEVAARDQAQARAAHAERMVALGELAGGIAHDFNNILQAISGNAELIERHPADPERVRRLAGVVLKAAARGGAIGRRLLAFARRDFLTSEPVDLAAVFDEVCELLDPSSGSEIAVRVDIEPGLHAVLADRAQLETVLLNLAGNALDAMPEGGDLTFSAASETIAQDRADPILKAGRYVRISVADSGTGMDPATQRRATEPFFTTKPKGKGTGLGLSMAQGFAEQSGGALSLESELGRGTTVRIWLPQADVAARSPREAVTRAPAMIAGPGRQWHVLVVDDDNLVREALMMSLSEAGFTTQGAENASRALAYLDGGDAVDALITDFAMPGMNGVELIREVQKREGLLPAILLTGHVSDIAATAAECRTRGGVTVLQKPVHPAELAERIAMVIKACGDPRAEQRGV